MWTVQGFGPDVYRARALTMLFDGIFRDTLYQEHCGQGIHHFETEKPAPSSLMQWYYPNPVQDLLSLSTEHKYETFCIFNAQGQMLQTGAIRNATIDFSALAPSIYIVKLKAPEGIEDTIIKVIKQ